LGEYFYTGEINLKGNRSDPVEDPVVLDRDQGSGGSYPVVPGQISVRGLLQISAVLQQPGQVIEGIDSGQLTGMDQAHEQVPDLSAPLGFIEQGVFAIQNSVLQDPLTEVVI
jgi:hypothetical protein